MSTSWADAGDEDHFEETPQDSPSKENNKHEEKNIQEEQHSQTTSNDVTEVKERAQKSHTAFVGNLDYEITSEKLREFFEKADCKVKEVRYIQKKYIAYVEFIDAESLKKSLELKGKVIISREIKIDEAPDRPNTSGSRNYSKGRGYPRQYNNDRGNRPPRDNVPREDRPPRDNNDRGPKERGSKPWDKRDDNGKYDRPNLNKSKESIETPVSPSSEKKKSSLVDIFGGARPRDEIEYEKKREEDKVKKKQDQQENNNETISDEKLVSAEPVAEVKSEEKPFVQVESKQESKDSHRQNKKSGEYPHPKGYGRGRGEYKGGGRGRSDNKNDDSRKQNNKPPEKPAEKPAPVTNSNKKPEEKLVQPKKNNANINMFALLTEADE